VLFSIKQKWKFNSICDDGESFVSKPRFFDSPECKGCLFKGGSYCWSQYPYNIWRRDRF